MEQHALARSDDGVGGANAPISATPGPDPPPAPSGFDQPLHAAIAQLTSGVSPISMNLAYQDWLQHLALSPDKQIELTVHAIEHWQSFTLACMGMAPGEIASACVTPGPYDKRFSGPAWERWPFSMYARGFLLTQEWLRRATTDIPGVAKHHEEIVAFVTRQLLDAVAPPNFPLTNPLVLQQAVREGGLNFLRGARNAIEDRQRDAAGALPAGTQAFEVGRNVAVTPGKVVFRNRLIELIQYSPATAEVYPEPILIVPAWIMKYYILDLSPADSLVRYLVGNGHTVFIISWKNPTEADRELCLEDYRRLGCMDAFDAVSAIVPDRPIQGVGYCIGGTLLAIAAAAMARDNDRRLKTLTLFAAQTDFTEAGEISLFIDEAEIAMLDDMMSARGYLDGKQMAGAFKLLRSNDLIWSPRINDHLLGERAEMTDLMAWNADSTRMPYRMHSEYLHGLFLNNDLARGRLEAGGRPVSLHDLRAPIFAVSTITDHVAPWKSVFKIHELTNAEITFVLSNGGHNVGIVNPPGNPKRHYQVAVHAPEAVAVDPERWQSTSALHQDSWWPAWRDWLVRHSGTRGPTPSIGAAARGYVPLCDAPGTYVLGR